MARVFDYGRGQWSLGGRVYVMGILNVTPDSFSDGGRYLGVEAAMAQAEQLLKEGADAIDVGGESTRPGHQPVSADVEWERIAPVLQGLRARFPEAVISVDTQKAVVADRALDAGADIINDIWGLAGDPRMIEVVARRRAGLVMMYNRAPAWGEGQVDVAAMKEFFSRQLDRAQGHGIRPERILVDPGLGFGYAVRDNWVVLRNLETFRGLAAGLLLGPSRKRFLGLATGRAAPERDVATATVAALAYWHGMDVVRVHKVAGVLDAVRVAQAWREE